jgi:hypothetical protein
MIAVDERSRHEEVWLLLPWLANGRVSAAERELAEEHLRKCAECEREFAVQNEFHTAFTEPDRVTYAPGPSFRKLMARIDADSKSARPAPRTKPVASEASLWRRLGHVSLWRPPGLAWAASFLLVLGTTGMMVTAYRWSQPSYSTYTATPAVTPDVLHIALDRALPIGDVEELLHANGARIVEGPGSTGVLGVVPIGVIAGQTSASGVNKQLRALSARLRTDPRVLWVQPLADEGASGEQRAPDAQEH